MNKLGQRIYCYNSDIDIDHNNIEQLIILSSTNICINYCTIKQLVVINCHNVIIYNCPNIQQLVFVGTNYILLRDNEQIGNILIQNCKRTEIRRDTIVNMIIMNCSVCGIFNSKILQYLVYDNPTNDLIYDNTINNLCMLHRKTIEIAANKSIRCLSFIN